MPILTDHQEHLVSLLLASFPNFQSGDSEAAIAAYAMVITDANDADVEAGIHLLIRGEYPGHDGRFAPTAPILATAIRKARDKRLDFEQKRKKPMLPPPDIEKTDESRERVKRLTNEAVGRLAESLRTDEAAAAKRRDECANRVHERFDPDQSEDAVRNRLKI